jgi:predicted N-acetyltransferase YhbS
VTSEELVRSAFGCPLERSKWEIELYDDAGCVAHAGIDVRHTRWDAESEPLEVAAIRFVVVRPDMRRRGIGLDVMDAAHEMARFLDLPYAVLFTDVPEFYEKAGYETTERPRGMVHNVSGGLWPQIPWEPVGAEW